MTITKRHEEAKRHLFEVIDLVTIQLVYMSQRLDTHLELVVVSNLLNTYATNDVIAKTDADVAQNMSFAAP